VHSIVEQLDRVVRSGWDITPKSMTRELGGGMNASVVAQFVQGMGRAGEWQGENQAQGTWQTRLSGPNRRATAVQGSFIYRASAWPFGKAYYLAKFS